MNRKRGTLEIQQLTYITRQSYCWRFRSFPRRLRFSAV